VPGDVRPFLARGNTIVFDDGTWLDLNQMRAGDTTAKQVQAPDPIGLPVRITQHGE